MAEANEGIVLYKCPNCAGPLTFGIASQQWECHFCNASFTAAQKAQFEEFRDGSETDAAFVPDSAGRFGDAEAVCYTCPTCGGSVVADRNTAATFCVYCHNPAVIAGRLRGDYRPAKIIPFKKTKQEAVEALQKLCKGRPFLPRLFKDAARKGEIAGLYVPYWLFGGDYDTMLTGTGTRVSSWRDSRYIYTKTDSYRVERGARIPIRMVPVDGSRRMDDSIMEAIEPFMYYELVDFSMQYLSGHVAESYDVDAAACGQRYDQRAQAAINSTMRGMVTGYATSTVHTVQHHCQNREVLYVMLPVWTLMAPYNGKTYNFTMNAQTGKIVGRLPVSWAKVAGWFGGITAAATLAVWLGGFLL